MKGLSLSKPGKTLIISASLLALAICVFVFTIFWWQHGFTLALSSSLTVLTAAVTLGMALLYVLGRTRFGGELKRAYLAIGVGVLFLGMSQILVNTAVIAGGLPWLIVACSVVIPASLLVFEGVRSITRLFHVDTVLTSYMLGALYSVAGVMFFSLFPHTDLGGRLSELSFQVLIAFLTTGLVFCVFCVWLSWVLLRTASNIYKETLVWMLVAFTAAASAMGIHIVVFMAFTPGTWIYDSGIAQIPLIAAIVCFARAGYLAQSARLGKSWDKDSDHPASSPGIITHVASLAANQRDIEQFLDEFRDLSASLPEDGRISEDAQTKLMSIYLQLENYLTTQERVNPFTRESLRKNVEESLFTHEGSENTFWQSLDKQERLKA